jgi:hypothetical protein
MFSQTMQEAQPKPKTISQYKQFLQSGSLSRGKSPRQPSANKTQVFSSVKHTPNLSARQSLERVQTSGYTSTHNS